MKYAVLFFSILNFLFGCTPIQNIHDKRVEDLVNKATIVNVNFQKQTVNYSCGVAALVSVLTYWRIQISQEEILEKYPPENIEKGYSIGELKLIAEDQKLNAFALRGDYEFLKKHLSLGRPLIVPLEIEKDYFFRKDMPFVGFTYRLLSYIFIPTFDHFVVVIGFDNNRVWLMDPQRGIKTMPDVDFNKKWQKKNNAILLISSA